MVTSGFDRETRMEAGRGEDTLVARAHMVCGECRHAQLFPVQPQAVCTCPGAGQEGQVVFSGQPACDHVAPRGRDERTMAWCRLRSASVQLRFGRIPPHLY